MLRTGRHKVLTECADSLDNEPCIVVVANDGPVLEPLSGGRVDICVHASILVQDQVSFVVWSMICGTIEERATGIRETIHVARLTVEGSPGYAIDRFDCVYLTSTDPPWQLLKSYTAGAGSDVGTRASTFPTAACPPPHRRARRGNDRVTATGQDWCEWLQACIGS